MSNFKQDATQLLSLIGGKENISAVTHCATRMRFALVDPSQADVKAIEALPSVKGSFTQAGQFQVIIGNAVSEFYKEFQAVSGVGEASKDEVKAAAKKNQSLLQRAMTTMAEIFAPIIPAIIVGGLILGFRNILENVPLEFLGQNFVNGQAQFNPDGTILYNSIVDVSQFWSGVNHFLWLPGEAIFHFLPVGIVWSVTRKMGTTQILGIVLGITLVSPNLLTSAYDYVQASKDQTLKFWDFGFFKLNAIGYQAQVIPAILAGLALSYLEIFWRKVVPEVLSMILVPFLALVPAVILAHTVLGPIGWTIGDWISQVVRAGLTGTFSWLFGAIFGAFYAPLVITGLHHMTNAIDSELIARFNGTGLWPMIALSNIAQGSAVLAVWWLTRKDEEQNQITVPSTISCYLGVTEPALFGVNLKYLYPFLAGMIGSSIAGLIATTYKVTSNAIGVGGLPGFLAIQPGSMAMFFVCMAVALVVPFVVTLFFNRQFKFLDNKALDFDIPFFNK